MSAILRTVRQMERSETRTIAGFEIESGLPIPKPRTPNNALYTALAAMMPGDSMVHTHDAKRTRKRLQADTKGRVFSVRMLGPRKYRIWRTS